MRKALKIKASVLLVAWTVIFAHSVIPHNHVYEVTQSCSTPIHYCCTASSGDHTSCCLRNEHSDGKVCHLSNSLFNNLTTEVFLAFVYRNHCFIASGYSCLLIPFKSEFYISGHHEGSNFLRAPPQS